MIMLRVGVEQLF